MSRLSKRMCGRKRCYESAEDAFVAASTRMRDHLESDDWRCFRVYLCQRCGKYHLTKERMISGPVQSKVEERGGEKDE